jgi:pyruvate,orthophosphate dikinase
VNEHTGAGAATIDRQVARALDPDDPTTREDAVAAVSPVDVEVALHPRADASAVADGGRLIATGFAASPGVATGAAVFDSWRALDLADEGVAVILVRPETSPADEPALSVAEGVLTSRGGTSSHAAVVARGRGLPAVCGAEALSIGDGSMTAADGEVVWERDLISIDGFTGEVRVGGLEVTRGDVPEELLVLLGWADEVRRGRIAVHANADTAEDAARARQLGADGIGLCRTEHQFLGERLPLLQRVILASDPTDESAALDALIEAQREDLVGVLRAMDRLPVTIRLLDAPLHEFLPDLRQLERDDAAGTLSEADAKLLGAARRWVERNPMLGVRGVRLGLVKPALYRAQIRALVEATNACVAEGGDPRPRVLVPMVADPSEVVAVRSMVAAAVHDEDVELPVGAMIETPRAALVAGALAHVVDFVSFGTNDLTQMTFGLSRDDVPRLLESYLADGVLPADPFATLDVPGVGELLRHAVAQARAVRTDLEISVCGEHGADPASIGFFVEAGVDEVSCSPFRVPVARLAAAQAVLR